MPDSCNIRIYDRNFNWINATEQAESVQLGRELYGVGKLEIKINTNKSGAADLARRGNIVVINNDMHKAAVIRDFVINESRGESYFTIYGETAAGFAKQRISVPPTQAQNAGALGWDRIRDKAETVLKHYVDRNLVNPYDAKRKIPNLVMAPDLGRGIEVPSQLRYTNLAEDLASIGEYAEMGFEIYAGTAAGRWVFDVIEGADRTTEQDALSPVTFNMEYQNIEDYRYTEDYQNYRNTGYAGGSGENEKRLVYILGAENEGADRWEAFLDCGNIATINELTYYGGLKLAECTEAKTLEASALPKAFVFGRDYFMGDKVTVFISRLGLRLHTRITAVKEIWERPAGYKTEIRFGGKVPNLFTILQNKQGVR